jgi:hypothetical protein
MYDSNHELITALQATPQTLRGLLRDLSPEQTRQVQGDNETWPPIAILCHLRDTEEYVLRRLRAILHQDNPTISGFDQEGWVVERNYAADDPQRALEAFAQWRAAHVAELTALTAEQWQRTGNHVQHGRTTVFNHTLHMVYHDIVHTAQIARQLG